MHGRVSIDKSKASVNYYITGNMHGRVHLDSAKSLPYNLPVICTDGHILIRQK